VNLQDITSVIINESQFPKPVHEEAHPRASCTHHLCQRLLTDSGNSNFVLALFAEVSEQCEHPGKSLFAGIEELVNQILLISDVPCQTQSARRSIQLEIAVNVYTAMTEATLFHFAHSLANSVKARPDMLNLDAGAPPRKNRLREQNCTVFVCRRRENPQSRDST